MDMFSSLSQKYRFGLIIVLIITPVVSFLVTSWQARPGLVVAKDQAVVAARIDWQNKLATAQNALQAAREQQAGLSSQQPVYENTEYGFSFRYPRGFFLLDRLGQAERSIFVNSQLIAPDDPKAPIVISVTDNTANQELIGILGERETKNITVDGVKTQFTEGISPASGQYEEFRVILVVFDNPALTLKACAARDCLGGTVDFDPDGVVNEILASWRFN